MARTNFLDGQSRRALYSVTSPTIPGSTGLGTFNVAQFARFVQVFSVIGSLTLVWKMGVSSGNFQVTSSTVINSGGNIVEVINVGQYADFSFSAANSQIISGHILESQFDEEFKTTRGTDMKNNNEVTAIDSEIAAMNATLAKLHASKEAGEPQRQRLEAERREIAFAALGAEDALSRQQLSDLQKRTREVTDELVDISAALDQAELKLSDLQCRRTAAYLKGKRAEYETEKAAVISEGESLEKLLSELISKKSKFDHRLKLMSKLAVEAQVDPRHERLLRIFWRCVEQRLNSNNRIWMVREARATFLQPLPPVFRAVRNGTSEINEESEQKAS